VVSWGMDNDEPNEQMVSPASADLHVVSTTVVPAGEAEVAAMLAEQVRFSDEPETQALAYRLLEAGHTVRSTARRLGVRPATVWSWSTDPEGQEAIQAGQARRRSVLGEGLEEAAEAALSSLLEVATDLAAAPRDRVKASEAILDRCGITPHQSTDQTTVAVSVDVDFDERLARIVAGAQS
jgi:transposase-like protein